VERQGCAVAGLPDGTEIATLVPVDSLPSGELTLGIRAEHIVAGEGAEARVVVIERLGERTLIYADLRDGSTVVYDEPGTVQLDIGQTVRLAFDGAAAHLFGPDGVTIRG
jgi:multiple sugar transport system ATP-binding protein